MARPLFAKSSCSFPQADQSCAEQECEERERHAHIARLRRQIDRIEGKWSPATGHLAEETQTRMISTGVAPLDLVITWLCDAAA